MFLLFVIQNFSFLSKLMFKKNIGDGNFELFYNPVQSWQNDGDITDDDDIQNYTANHCYCYSILDSILELFTTTRLELDSKSKTTTRRGLLTSGSECHPAPSPPAHTMDSTWDALLLSLFMESFSQISLSMKSRTQQGNNFIVCPNSKCFPNFPCAL